MTRDVSTGHNADRVRRWVLSGVASRALRRPRAVSSPSSASRAACRAPEFGVDEMLDAA
jgi:hypothetical protein